MEIRVLQYFLMVAREENITRAAHLLHVTQPTLSRQLMQLEEELGVTLFSRGNHRITLTEEGLLLRRRAEEIVLLSEKTKADLQRREGALSGTIFVGAGELRSSQFLAQLMAAFRKDHPLVRFELYSGNADNIKERIERGVLDVGLVPEPVELAKYEFLRTPIQEQWCALVREDSPLAQLEHVCPEDLLGIPLILPQREILQKEMARWFGPLWEKLDIAASGKLLYNMAVLVREMDGCVLTMQRLDCQFDGLRPVQLSPPLEAGTVLIWKRSPTFSPVTGAFLHFSKSFLTGMKDNEK